MAPEGRQPLMEAPMGIAGKAGRLVQIGADRLGVKLAGSAVVGEGRFHPIGEFHRPRSGVGFPDLFDVGADALVVVALV